jgi:hypothetical protein
MALGLADVPFGTLSESITYKFHITSVVPSSSNLWQSRFNCLPEFLALGIEHRPRKIRIHLGIFTKSLWYLRMALL